VFEFRNPFFLLRDPEIIKQISIKDFDHFTDHRVLVDPKIEPLFSASLFSMTGQKWKDMRSSLSPVFTGSKMRQMFQCVSDCGANMAESFLEEAKAKGAQTHEMKDVFTRFTNDVIASSAFGIEVNSFKERDNEFYKLGLKIVNFKSIWIAFKFVGFLLMPWLMNKLKIRLADHQAISYFKNIIGDNFHTRETQNIVRHDLIQLLMQIKKGKLSHSDEKEDKTIDGFATVEESEVGKQVVERKWTDDELMAQCFLFFFAGFDTGE
jgi:cytochrome P450 family 9